MACSKCHKLFQKKEVEDFQIGETRAIMKCQHIEFPNSTARRLRWCQVSLSEQTPSINKIKTKSILVFSFAGIRQQLIKLYNWLGFENSLWHWKNCSNFNDILADIYDGQVWKTFKETNDVNSEKFFWPEVADSNLGLMLNLDWF